MCVWMWIWCCVHSFDADHNGILSKRELPKVLEHLKKGKKLKPQHMKMFRSFVDVDSSDTVSFAEFALALKRAQDDFVLNEVLEIEDLAQQAEVLATRIRNGEFRSKPPSLVPVVQNISDEDLM